MNRIREIRNSKNIKQADLAKMLNVSQGTLSNWERGEHDPDSQSLLTLSKILNTTIDDLLGNNEEKLINNNKKSSPPEQGTIEWFKQGLLKYGIVKEGNDLTDSQFQFLLDNVGFIAEQLRTRQFKNNN